MTYAEIETGVRTLLQDKQATYRWTAAEMYGYMPEAIRVLFSIRPAALFVNGRMPSTLALLEPPTTTAAISASGNVTANVNDRYFQALVYYVGAKCLERDDSDTANIALAGSYMNNFASFAKN